MAKQIRRHLVKGWRNGPAEKCTAAIFWWEVEGGSNIRLELHDTVRNGQQNLFPENRNQAELLWNRFILFSPRIDAPDARSTPVIEKLLDSLRQGKSNG